MMFIKTLKFYVYKTHESIWSQYFFHIRSNNLFIVRQCIFLFGGFQLTQNRAIALTNLSQISKEKRKVDITYTGNAKAIAFNKISFPLANRPTSHWFYDQACVWDMQITTFLSTYVLWNSQISYHSILIINSHSCLDLVFQVSCNSFTTRRDDF